jgi:hypothetical protein
LNSSLLESGQHYSRAGVSDRTYVPVALFFRDHLLDIQDVPMEEGCHEVTFMIEENTRQDLLIAVVDPFQEYAERDEDNNTLSMDAFQGNQIPIEELGVDVADGVVHVSITPRDFVLYEHGASSVLYRWQASCTRKH